MSADLVVDGLVAGYGETRVLEDVSFALPSGGTLALLGRNGVGKTTLLSSLMGFTRHHAGHIRFREQGIERLAPFRRNRAGLGLVPQEREIFGSLTVEENLAIAHRPDGWPLARVYELFPGLGARRRNSGGKLSGGEQQMLAIGRALVGAPRLLLLDEPMEGLAPVVVEALYEALRAIRDAGGLGMILVEQKAELALALTERVIVLDRGRIVHEGPSAALLANPALQTRLLAVGADGHAAAEIEETA